MLLVLFISGDTKIDRIGPVKLVFLICLAQSMHLTEIKRSAKSSAAYIFDALLNLASKQ